MVPRGGLLRAHADGGRPRDRVLVEVDDPPLPAHGLRDVPRRPREVVLDVDQLVLLDVLLHEQLVLVPVPVPGGAPPPVVDVAVTVDLGGDSINSRKFPPKIVVKNKQQSTVNQRCKCPLKSNITPEKEFLDLLQNVYLFLWQNLNRRRKLGHGHTNLSLYFGVYF